MSREQSGGHDALSIRTLVISSASAVAAAVLVPLFWERGTLIATALTPIVVAVVSELLKRPAERIPPVGVWRRTAAGTAIREPAAVGRRLPEEERVEVAPGSPEPPGRRRRVTRRHVRVGLITGALAFAIGAAAVTGYELLFSDESVSKGDRRTTLFGGGTGGGSGRERDAAEPAAPTAAPADPAEPSEPTPTPAPDEPAPSPTATPSPSGEEPAPSPTPAPGEILPVP